MTVDDRYAAILAGDPDWTAHLRVVSPEEWKRAVLCRDGGCVMEGYGPCDGRLEGHHVITQAQLKKRGCGDVLWDVRNGATLCYRHHRRHTGAVERMPFELIPGDAHIFAAELGLGWIIDRFYPRTEAAA